MGAGTGGGNKAADATLMSASQGKKPDMMLDAIASTAAHHLERGQEAARKRIKRSCIAHEIISDRNLSSGPQLVSFPTCQTISISPSHSQSMSGWRGHGTLDEV